MTPRHLENLAESFSEVPPHRQLCVLSQLIVGVNGKSEMKLDKSVKIRTLEFVVRISAEQFLLKLS